MRDANRFQPGRAGQVDDVEGSSGLSGKAGGPPNRFGFDLGWTRGGERIRLCAPGSQHVRGQPIDGLPALGVDAHQHSGLSGGCEGPGERRVVDHQALRVGQVELHTGHALLEQPSEERFRLVRTIGHGGYGQVEPVIDGSPASGLGVPVQKRLLRTLSPRTGEVQHARRTSARRRHRAALEVVRRADGPDREIEVGVDVDPARDHQRAAGVDDARA